MGVRRVVLVVTGVAVASLAVVFAVMWKQANTVATVVSALAAVAGVGVAVWAALGGSVRKKIRVVKTGKATSGSGGQAVTGLRGPIDRVEGEIVVKGSGEADASAGGDAASGVDLT